MIINQFTLAFFNLILKKKIHSISFQGFFLNKVTEKEKLFLNNCIFVLSSLILKFVRYEMFVIN